MSDNSEIYQNVEKKVADIILEYSNANNQGGGISVDDHFDNFGINSVDFIKIIVGIETAFDFEFLDDDLQMGRFNNMRQLIEYVIERTEYN